MRIEKPGRAGLSPCDPTLCFCSQHFICFLQPHHIAGSFPLMIHQDARSFSHMLLLDQVPPALFTHMQDFTHLSPLRSVVVASPEGPVKIVLKTALVFQVL